MERSYLVRRLRSLVVRNFYTLPPSASQMAVLREAFTGCRLPLPHLPLPGIQTLDPESVMMEYYFMLGNLICEEVRCSGSPPSFRDLLEKYTQLVYWRAFLSSQASILAELGVVGDPSTPGFFLAAPSRGRAPTSPIFVAPPRRLQPLLNVSEATPPSLLPFFFQDAPPPPAPVAAAPIVAAPALPSPELILPDRPAGHLVVVLPDEPRILPRPFFLESEVDHEGPSSDDSLLAAIDRYDDLSESSGDSDLAVSRANRP